MACKCYHADRNFLGKIGVCWGTKECEACSCGGDESKCDFYNYVRERASLSHKQTNADRIRAMTDEELEEFLEKVGGCGPSFDEEYCNNVNGCPEGSNCWLKWLRQEAT